MNIKKSALYLLITIFLVLDFAALGSSTSGNKSSLLLEYLSLLISTPVLGYYFTKLIAIPSFKTQRYLIKLTPLKEYHIHHSVVGALIIFLGLFQKTIWGKTVLVGLGYGMLLHHTITEGLIFVSKSKDDKIHKVLIWYYGKDREKSLAGII